MRLRAISPPYRAGNFHCRIAITIDSRYPFDDVDLHPKSANDPFIALNPAFQGLKKLVSKEQVKERLPSLKNCLYTMAYI